MCNSVEPDTRIIGNFNLNLDNATPIGTLNLPIRRVIGPFGQQRPNIIGSVGSTSRLSDVNSPIRTRFQDISDTGKQDSSNVNLNPSAESSLNQIAKVISGQLLTLQEKTQGKEDDSSS